MSSPPSLAPFVRALLNDIENNEAPRNKRPLLGMARRYETKKTKWDRPARLVLRALILHAPDPESMTREFWQALRKGENATILSHCDAVEKGLFSPNDVERWAAMICSELKRSDHAVKPLTDLASHYLAHLLIAFMTPRIIRRPAAKCHYPLDKERAQMLLAQAKPEKKLLALRDLVLLRDGASCLLTRFPLDYFDVRCSRIIPYTAIDEPNTMSAIETFSGGAVNAALIGDHVNLPENAMVLEYNAYYAKDRFHGWGIEATCVEGEWKYIFRVLRAESVAATIKLQDGDEISFGQRDGTIALPDPGFCNLQLAVARASQACGLPQTFADVM